MIWPFLLFLAGTGTLLLLLVRRALIPLKEAERRLQEGALLVDVRTAEEFHGGHVPGALNLPLSDLRKLASSALPDTQKVVLVYCLGGGRAVMAQRLLRTSGYAHVYNLGGLKRAKRAVRAREEENRGKTRS